MSQVDVVLFSHFHIDHSSDFPALIFSSWFEDRKSSLPVFGPPGNEFMPSTTEFVRDLFNEPHGAWRHMSELVDAGREGSYKLDRIMFWLDRCRFSCFATPKSLCMRCG
ncbi:ribonuclease BN (tRNA processing enzyme) [Edaphobacter lichenicola]|uniref:Ribonuclease BN (tRNA processing enzyme) n=2 Tax=Tunturiibacter TaxID=3154218 RepID=A0A7Y9T391_9BACT|nr:ribonuclease BN (tRNA processing enzyme) [Edaphobacter lichenicola]